MWFVVLKFAREANHSEFVSLDGSSSLAYTWLMMSSPSSHKEQYYCITAPRLICYSHGKSLKLSQGGENKSGQEIRNAASIAAEKK